jgi:hypothetical protein
VGGVVQVLTTRANCHSLVSPIQHPIGDEVTRSNDGSGVAISAIQVEPSDRWLAHRDCGSCAQKEKIHG